jgi:hypothetical protein
MVVLEGGADSYERGTLVRHDGAASLGTTETSRWQMQDSQDQILVLAFRFNNWKTLWWSIFDRQRWE